MSKLIGYARVSTAEQNPLQLDALKSAGCDRVYVEAASGAQRDRPELHKAFDSLREALERHGAVFVKDGVKIISSEVA